MAELNRREVFALKIVADENIPFVREAFGAHGDVELHAGRSIGAEQVRDADALLVRSVTPVRADLLRDSRVSFVGTATIGTDHVDLDWLRERGIGFASAPGSNANSVAEYVVAALLCLAEREGVQLAGRTLGVVGVGNVGGRVVALATALGLRVLRNDPPKARETGDAMYRPLEEVLGEADVVTLHVPLEREGPDATLGMVDEAFLARMKPGSWLLNTSRGAVASSAALVRARRSGRLSGLVCDVWEGEPLPRRDLVEAADLGTPHIAGYSFDGKLAGVEMILEAFCRHFGFEPRWNAESHLPPPGEPVCRIAGGDPQAVCRMAVRHAYDIEVDDADLRATLSLPDPERAVAFDRLRREYRVRREFRAFEIVAEPDVPAVAVETLRALGFRVPASAKTE